MKIPNSALVGPREAKVRDSIDFHYQTAYVLQMTWEHCEIDYKDWQEILSEVKERETYNHIPPDNPYGSLEVMLIDLGIEPSLAVDENKFENRMAEAAQSTVEVNGQVGRPGPVSEIRERIAEVEAELESRGEKVTQQKIADRVGISQPRVNEIITDGGNLLLSVIKKTVKQRAKDNGASESTQRKIDYLYRNDPNLFEQVKSGELRPHTAYKQARGIKDPTDFDLLKKYWDKITQDEQTAFLEWTNMSRHGKI